MTFNPDWDELQACRDSLREHLAMNAKLKAAIQGDGMGVKFSEIVYAIIAYVGPLDDPRIGWLGDKPSNLDLFQCERCGMENKDSSKIEHEYGCSAANLLSILDRLRTNGSK